MTEGIFLVLFEIYGPPLLTLQEKKALCRFDPPTEDLLLWMLAACLHTPLLPPKPNFLFYDIQRKKVVLFTVLSNRENTLVKYRQNC